MTVLSKLIAGVVTLGGAAAMRDDGAAALVKKSMGSHAEARLLAGKTAADCPYAAKLHRKQLMGSAKDEAQRKLIEDRLEKNMKGAIANKQLLRGRVLQAGDDTRLFLADYMTCAAG